MMEEAVEQYAFWGVVGVFVLSLAGIFWTKTKGFGKYTTSTVLLTLVLFVASIAFVTQRVEWEPLANILFAVAGFAGGLITSKADDK
jgi:FtsH-binding integral membrane protein